MDFEEGLPGQEEEEGAPSCLDGLEEDNMPLRRPLGLRETVFHLTACSAASVRSWPIAIGLERDDLRCRVDFNRVLEIEGIELRAVRGGRRSKVLECS